MYNIYHSTLQLAYYTENKWIQFLNRIVKLQELIVNSLTIFSLKKIQVLVSIQIIFQQVWKNKKDKKKKTLELNWMIKALTLKSQNYVTCTILKLQLSSAPYLELFHWPFHLKFKKHLYAPPLLFLLKTSESFVYFKWFKNLGKWFCFVSAGFNMERSRMFCCIGIFAMGN